jgi:AcrR family transcriptional regulator
MKPSSYSAKPVRLRERIRGETQAAILAAAEDSFAVNGLGARMEAIAARAGVAVGTVYNHFEDRDALLAALIDSRRAALLTRLDAALEDGARRTFEEALRAFLRALFDHWAAHARLLAVLVQAEQLGRLGASPGQGRCDIIQEIERRADRIMRRGLDERKLRPEGQELYAALFIGMTRGVLVHEAREQQGERLQNHADRILDLFLRGAGR